MTSAQMLTALKTDLQITATAYDARLDQLLTQAEAAIVKEGAENFDPTNDFADAQLTIMYARYLWTCRDTMAAMPRMVRWALNNRVLGDAPSAPTGESVPILTESGRETMTEGTGA